MKTASELINDLTEMINDRGDMDVFILLDTDKDGEVAGNIERAVFGSEKGKNVIHLQGDSL